MLLEALKVPILLYTDKFKVYNTWWLIMVDNKIS